MSKKAKLPAKETIDHPQHYGGEDNPYETIKIIEAWGFDEGFLYGNAIKYISRAKHKGNELEDLRKGMWYLNRLIQRVTKLQDKL